MAKIELDINGIKYPCRYTNGAMLRFKRETGYDISKSSGDISDSIVLLYCCILSACKADGVTFPYDLDTFADNTPVDVVTEWAASIDRQNSERANESTDGVKKK